MREQKSFNNWVIIWCRINVHTIPQCKTTLTFEGLVHNAYSICPFRKLCVLGLSQMIWRQEAQNHNWVLVGNAAFFQRKYNVLKLPDETEQKKENANVKMHVLVLTFYKFKRCWILLTVFLAVCEFQRCTCKYLSKLNFQFCMHKDYSRSAGILTFSQKKSSVMWRVWPITGKLCIFNFKYSD